MTPLTLLVAASGSSHGDSAKPASACPIALPLL